MCTRLIILLGDQLSKSLLDFADRDNDCIMMAEVVSEATYVMHHKKKIAFHFAAMRHFAAAVSYTHLTLPTNSRV